MKMKSNFLVFSAVSLFAFAAMSAVTVEQDAVTRTVKVSYTLAEDAIVTVDFQTNTVASGNGAWVSVGGRAQQSVAGEVNCWVRATEDGEVRRAFWFPDETWEGFTLPTAQLRAEIKTWTKLNPPDYMVVDLRTETNVTYYLGADYLPGGVGDIYYKTDAMVFRHIRAKDVEWLMGAEYAANSGMFNPNAVAHRVKLTSDYWFAVYECTKGQYSWIKNDPSSAYATMETLKTKAVPISWLSYTDIRGVNTWPVLDGNGVFDFEQSYAVDSSSPLAKFRAKTGLKWADLPTEAQWEFACRAGQRGPLYDGGAITIDHYMQLGRMLENSKEPINMNDDYYGLNSEAASVGSYVPNKWGIYDCYGNVSELCQDWYEDFSVCNDGGCIDQSLLYTDPVGPQSRTKRVLRGTNKHWNITFYLAYGVQDGSLTKASLSSARGDASGPTEKEYGSNQGFRLCVPIVDR